MARLNPSKNKKRKVLIEYVVYRWYFTITVKQENSTVLNSNQIVNFGGN